MSYILKSQVVGEFQEHDDYNKEVITNELFPCDVCKHYDGFMKHGFGKGCFWDDNSDRCYCFEYSDRYDVEGECEYMPTEYPDEEEED